MCVYQIYKNKKQIYDIFYLISNTGNNLVQL